MRSKCGIPIYNFCFLSGEVLYNKIVSTFLAAQDAGVKGGLTTDCLLALLFENDHDSAYLLAPMTKTSGAMNVKDCLRITFPNLIIDAVMCAQCNWTRKRGNHTCEVCGSHAIVYMQGLNLVDCENKAKWPRR